LQIIESNNRFLLCNKKVLQEKLFAFMNVLLSGENKAKEATKSFRQTGVIELIHEVQI
jgi:hypothetical protein